MRRPHRLAAGSSRRSANQPCEFAQFRSVSTTSGAAAAELAKCDAPLAPPPLDRLAALRRNGQRGARRRGRRSRRRRRTLDSFRSRGSCWARAPAACRAAFALTRVKLPLGAPSYLMAPSEARARATICASCFTHISRHCHLSAGRSHVARSRFACLARRRKIAPSAAAQIMRPLRWRIAAAAAKGLRRAPIGVRSPSIISARGSIGTGPRRLPRPFRRAE